MTKEQYLRTGKLNMFVSGLNTGMSILLAVLGVNFCFVTALLAIFNYWIATKSFEEAAKEQES